MLLLLICCSGCAGPSKPVPILATVPAAGLKWQGRLPVIHLNGSPYDLGYQHGSILRREVQASVENLLTLGAHQGMPGLRGWSAARRLDAAWKKLKPSLSDRYLEEMEGLADGAQAPLRLLQRVHALSDLAPPDCAGFSDGDKTAPTGSDVQRYAAILVYHPKGRRAFVSVGWLGHIGVLSGVNEAGIFVQGGSAPFLQRWILEEAGDLKEAAEISGSAVPAFVYASPKLWVATESTGSDTGPSQSLDVKELFKQ